jgi:RNA polymerase sigma factor (sigma-70 family)
MTPNELVENHLDIADRLAMLKCRSVPKCITFDELQSAAYVGLMDASRKFDPSLGVKFSSYANTRIRGAILDYLRGRDWIKHRSRKVNPPTVISFDVLRDREYIHTTDFEDAEYMQCEDTGLVTVYRQEFFDKVFSYLSGKRRKVMEMYYVKGMTMLAIGEEIGVGESMVSIILKKGRAHLKERWTEDELRKMLY